ncbi:LptF/LptG family permease [Bacteroidales bacterium OttesenSCG-928-B11]|nr:LptF/LptG family permease [Bacteroidales bacterium OttesenSCG-928-E04]MDL2308496.1 LptF/LptG family permease [Bacteroidales bacterium OttesenSCG-928-C03]MDL2311419.1 LptF/LptG family permease [Bacteroidales bacterium OttesenSCG-928-B11]MDL2325815.1 LptF/LptG family permease [Bacteroidales bacterium OttesenSCG-928-A14]
MPNIKETIQKWHNDLRWRLLDTYILKKFIGSFVYSIALLLAIIVVFDVSENIQRFIDNDVPFNKIIFSYYGNLIPSIINMFIPLFTFISVIWFTSVLSQRNEIVAILSSGINFYRLLLPYIVGSLIIVIFAIVMSNVIIPNTNRGLNEFKEVHFKRKKGSKSNIHLKNSLNSYIYVERWNKEEMDGQRFTYEELGNQSITKKISAQSFKYDQERKKWVFKNYVMRTIVDDEEFIVQGNEMDTVLNILPRDLDRDETIIETMDYKTMRRYIKEEKEKGSSFVNYYRIAQQKRVSNALGTIIMTLLGFSVASRKTQRGVGVHLFIGMGMAFSFIFLQQVSDVFAVSGGIPPGLGAWIPNIIFLVICIFMLKFTQK